jgi:hypothetical protein
MKIAFATCTDLPEGFEDDYGAAALVGAEWAVWSDPSVDWAAFDRVVIRSTWDYTHRAAEFVAWARSVGAQRLRNVPELIAFNSDKVYLATLAAPTVPTQFVRAGDPVPALDGEVVVKPTVSAGGRDTGRFGPGFRSDALALIERITSSGRTAMVQPYLSGVDAHGETAAVFFGGQFSHALHKKPVLRPDEVAPLADVPGAFAPAAVMFDPDLVTPGSADSAQVALASRVVAELTERFDVPLYVRVDMVPGPDGAPVVIEVEAVEPCLYLDLVPGAAERFAAAIRG